MCFLSTLDLLHTSLVLIIIDSINIVVSPCNLCVDTENRIIEQKVM